MNPSRAAELLTALSIAEGEYANDKRLLDAKHAPVLTPLREELRDMERRAKEIVTACGISVIDARSTWARVNAHRDMARMARLPAPTAKGYDSLTTVKIGPKIVTVGTQDYCGEGNYEAGAPITFPSRWLDLGSTHEARCAELGGWYADRAAQIAAKAEKARLAAEAAKLVADRAEFERLGALFAPASLREKLAKANPVQPTGPVWRCAKCDYWCALSDNMRAHTHANAGHVGYSEAGAEGTDELPRAPRAALDTHEAAAAQYPHSEHFDFGAGVPTMGKAFAAAKARATALGLRHTNADENAPDAVDGGPDGVILAGCAGKPIPTKFPMLRDVTLYWRDRGAKS